MRTTPFVDYDLAQSNRVDAAFLNALIFAGYGVATLAALKALVPPDGPVSLTVKAYAIAGDGGGGEFWWDSTSVEADNGGTVITPTAGGTGRWIRVYDELTVKMFGAVGDNVVDDTAAFIAAVAAVGEHARLRFPAGNYKVTSEWGPTQHRVHLVGDGPYATIITFAPAANGSCLKCDAPGGSVLYQGSIRDMTFFSADSTYVKTAIELVDTSGYAIENIVIGGSVAKAGSGYWGDATDGSIGIRTRGREAAAFRNIYNFADKPLVISPCPNSPTISADHFNFHNMYLGGSGNPIVTIEAGCVITQMSFTGYQAWVRGEGGLYWNDATTPGASNGLSLENVRYENPTDNTKYFVWINPASGLQGLRITGGQAGGLNGFLLRNIAQARFESFFFSLTGYEGLNADSTVDEMSFDNCFWQTGTTATLSDLDTLHQLPSATTGVIPSSGYIMQQPAVSSSYDEVLDTTVAGPEQTMAASAKYVIGGAQQTGLVVIATRDPAVGVYVVNGSAQAAYEVSDPSTLFTPTLGTPNSFNVGWDAGSSAYVVENGFAIQKILRVMRLGRAQ